MVNTNTGNESLRELDSILKPLAQKAMQQAKRGLTNPQELPKEFALAFQHEVDNTRTAISEKMYHIDMAMQGYGDSVERAFQEMHETQNPQPNVDMDKYVREANGGYQVWDGYRWIQLSNKAEINITAETGPEYGNKTVLILRATDPKTNTNVLFVDDDIHSSGFNISYNVEGGFDMDGEPRAFENRFMQWEDPKYNFVKSGTTSAGIAAGFLEVRQIGNLTPWRNGQDLKNAKGWYRNQEGIYRNLSHQKGFAKGAGGHQVGAKNAVGRVVKIAKASRVIFVVSVGFSTYEAGEAFIYNDSNKGEVMTKASIDITMAVIGTFGGPVGWIVSGSYFILDISGAFGDYGKPSGVRSDGVPYNTNQMGADNSEASNQYRIPSSYEINFDVEYEPTIEQNQQMYLREHHEVKVDNTYVVPKHNFKIKLE